MPFQVPDNIRDLPGAEKITNFFEFLDYMEKVSAIQDKYKQLGYHYHKCGSCSRVWEHGNEMAGDSRAHTCPECGSEQWVKHYPELTGAVIEPPVKVRKPRKKKQTKTPDPLK